MDDGGSPNEGKGPDEVCHIIRELGLSAQEQAEVDSTGTPRRSHGKMKSNHFGRYGLT